MSVANTLPCLASCKKSDGKIYFKSCSKKYEVLNSASGLTIFWQHQTPLIAGGEMKMLPFCFYSGNTAALTGGNQYIIMNTFH